MRISRVIGAHQPVSSKKRRSVCLCPCLCILVVVAPLANHPYAYLLHLQTISRQDVWVWMEKSLVGGLIQDEALYPGEMNESRQESLCVRLFTQPRRASTSEEILGSSGVCCKSWAWMHQQRQPASACSACSASSTPSPTLSPTDPVPRGLLTLCRAAY